MEIRPNDQDDWQVVLSLCRRVDREGGRAHLVGGSVRDSLLGREVSDFDLEIFGVSPQQLEGLLRSEVEVDLVGRSFGVFKVKGRPIDVALPRREEKTGLGHRAFEVLSDPEMTFEEAAARRDFTVNSMAWDPLRDEIIDPFGGRRDLERRILRHTSERFVEDPLRVLRGMQFVARFALEPASETVALCRSMGLEGLARERIGEEWRKLVLRGVLISSGLQFLRATEWVRFFPELAALIDCPQDPEWHPEGDVWTHTGHVMDAFARERVGEEHEDLVVGLACLCHDFGKPATTELADGRWRSLGHEQAGVAPTRSFLARLFDQPRLVEEIVPLVAHHLKPLQLYEGGAGDAAVRRLARKVGRIDRLVRVVRADNLGRPPLGYDGDRELEWLESRARALELADREPEPLVKGRHLIERGLEPGPELGTILDACFEAQLDGAFETLEDGLVWLDRHLEEALD